LSHWPPYKRRPWVLRRCLIYSPSEQVDAACCRPVKTALIETLRPRVERKAFESHVDHRYHCVIIIIIIISACQTSRRRAQNQIETHFIHVHEQRQRDLSVTFDNCCPESELRRRARPTDSMLFAEFSAAATADSCCYSPNVRRSSKNNARQHSVPTRRWFLSRDFTVRPANVFIGRPRLYSPTKVDQLVMISGCRQQAPTHRTLRYAMLIKWSQEEAL